MCVCVCALDAQSSFLRVLMFIVLSCVMGVGEGDGGGLCEAFVVVVEVCVGFRSSSLFVRFIVV